MRLFRPIPMPPNRQVGALCWRYDEKQRIEILTITTRRSRRWSIPKGGQIEGLSEQESASQEAWEEAGVRGQASVMPVGEYQLIQGASRSALGKTTVTVYSLHVTTEETNFPEFGQRKIAWRKPEKAAAKVREPDLARLIRDFVN
ncbi:MAG: NUDIX hydrolase [Pikeienuella sp.]